MNTLNILKCEICYGYIVGPAETPGGNSAIGLHSTEVTDFPRTAQAFGVLALSPPSVYYKGLELIRPRSRNYLCLIS